MSRFISGNAVFVSSGSSHSWSTFQPPPSMTNVTTTSGGAAGRAAKVLMRPDPDPDLEAMARDLGADHLELVRRQFHPERSGDLQLVLAPYNSSNYSNESTSLVRDAPRSSHAYAWM